MKLVADATGFTIILDKNRAGEHAKSPVTAQFRGVSLKEAVRVLADLAELKSVVLGNVMYVTTPDHADKLAAEEKQRLREQRALEAEKENKEREREQRALQAEKENKVQEDAKKKVK